MVPKSRSKVIPDKGTTAKEGMRASGIKIGKKYQLGFDDIV